VPARSGGSGATQRHVNIVATIAAVAGILFGYGTGVIAGALLFIRADFGLSPLAQGIVVSAMLLGATAGSGIAGTISDRLGRRTAIVVAGTTFAIGALVSALAPSAAVLVAGRVIGGIGVGLASSAAPVYISEMAPARVRGALLTLFQLAVTTGLLLAFLVDFALAASEAWRWMLGLSAIPAVLLAAGMIFVPPSPRWLMTQGREEEARAVLAELRHEELDGDLELELAEIRSAADAPQASWRELLRPVVRAALVVGVGLALLQQLTGINAVLYYAPTIFQNAGFTSSTSAILASAGLGVVNVLMTVVAIAVIDRFGRRVLLLAGSVGMVAGLFALGLVFAIGTSSSDLTSGLAVASTAVYLAAFAISLGPIVWVLNAEIYPLSVRGRASGVASLAHWAANFVVVLTFLPLLDLIGDAAMYWVYAGIALAGILFIWTLVPETRGRSLENIEAVWRERAARSRGGAV
jgi:SP family galactose:H+ symporter-like MFS transporter